MVEQAADALIAADSLILAITPEGTRSRTPFWMSGFYHIATAAAVPILLVYFDRPTRRTLLDLRSIRAAMSIGTWT